MNYHKSAVLRKTLIRSEKQHIYTNIYNKSLANAKPNQKQEEEIYSNSKSENGKPQNKTKIKIFLWKKSNTPDEIGLRTSPSVTVMGGTVSQPRLQQEIRSSPNTCNNSSETNC